MKRINIIEEYEDQKPMEANVFYTPPNSPSKLMNENEPSWPIGIDRWSFIPYRVRLMLDLQMSICDELLNLGPGWHSPVAPSSHAPTKNVDIFVNDLGNPPGCEGSNNYTPCKSATVKSKCECVDYKHSLHGKSKGQLVVINGWWRH